MSRHIRSCVTTLRAVCSSSGVCRDILRLWRDTEGSLGILYSTLYVVTSNAPCCNIVTNIELRVTLKGYTTFASFNEKVDLRASLTL
ncbi:hypothetical protein PVK06_010973 [Gossypium arboreum]|uniref:Secreted protein n=1 Tax=Gossypium arboreum TaxID=29729 RepID=A0ABR0Q7I6_GOSAR|nr:hypothetical protein PVK06_010973 [Gossypium arboreum]